MQVSCDEALVGLILLSHNLVGKASIRMGAQCYNDLKDIGCALFRPKDLSYLARSCKWCGVYLLILPHSKLQEGRSFHLKDLCRYA